MQSETVSRGASAGASPREVTTLRRFVADFCESKGAVAAAAVLLVIILAAVFAPLISPQDPYDLAEISVMNGRLRPGEQSMEGFTFWLGTDAQGRDILSAILYGLRISLFVGVASGLIALSIGVAVGLTAAFFGGRVDTVIMRIVDLQLSFPAILVALILLAVLGRGVDKIILALVVVQWAYYTRTVRASALVERQREYIEAAMCLALSTRMIIFSHLLPNVLPPLVVVATVQVAHAIAGGHPVIPRHRPPRDRAVSRTADLERLRLHDERRLLDKFLSRRRAAAQHRNDQPCG